MNATPQDDSWDPVATVVLVWLAAALLFVLLPAHIETAWPGFLFWVFFPVMFLVLCWMAAVTNERRIREKARRKNQDDREKDDQEGQLPEEADTRIKAPHENDRFGQQ